MPAGRRTIPADAEKDRVSEAEVAAWLRGLGRRVRLLRLTREMTQDDLATAAGMSRSFVSLIEHGTHGVDVVRLIRLAAALGVPLGELLGTTTLPDRRPPG